MKTAILFLLLFTGAANAADNKKSNNKLSDSTEFYQNLCDKPVKNQSELERMVKEDLESYDSTDTVVKSIEEVGKKNRVVILLQRWATEKQQTEAKAECNAVWNAYAAALHIATRETLKSK